LLYFHYIDFVDLQRFAQRRQQVLHQRRRRIQRLSVRREAQDAQSAGGGISDYRDRQIHREVAFDSDAPARDGGGNFYLGATDPVDYYKFTITEAGNYHFGAYDADLGGAKQTLYDADGKQLDSRKASAHEVEELPTKYLAAGDYYLKMEWTGTTGDYNLGLLKA